MKLFHYLWRGLFGPKCPRCEQRDFEWTCGGGKGGPGIMAWDLKCNLCQAKYWKFKGSDDRLFKYKTEESFSNWAGDYLTEYEKEKMTNTFDGRVVCPDCEHYPLCGNADNSWSCTNCNSEFNLVSCKGGFTIRRISDRMPELVQIRAPAPEPDRGFFLEGSL